MRDTLPGHSGGVTALVSLTLPRGRVLLASGSTDTTVRLWDPDTGTPIGKPLGGHTKWVRALAAVTLPDARVLLASGSDDHTVRLWDPATSIPGGGTPTGHVGPTTAPLMTLRR